MRVPLALVCLVVGCSGGDLLLPESADPVTLSIVSGDDQRADTGDLLDEPLVVLVVDADTNPVPGIRVKFDFLNDGSGGVLDPALATTDERGRAQTFVRLGTEDGVQLILASVDGTASPDLSARFSAVALGSNGGGGGKKDKGNGHGGGNGDDD